MVARVVIPASALLSDPWPLRGMPAQTGYRPAAASPGGSGAGGQGDQAVRGLSACGTWSGRRMCRSAALISGYGSQSREPNRVHEPLTSRKTSSMTLAAAVSLSAI